MNPILMIVGLDEELLHEGQTSRLIDSLMIKFASDNRLKLGDITLTQHAHNEYENHTHGEDTNVNIIFHPINVSVDTAKNISCAIIKTCDELWSNYNNHSTSDVLNTLADTINKSGVMKVSKIHDRNCRDLGAHLFEISIPHEKMESLTR